MAFRTSVPAGVSVGRRIAAQRGAARLARTQVHPAGANQDALLAHSPLRLLDLVN
jgi:hypothetical protein